MSRQLGILGGMGPLATADFLGKITRQTQACCDQEHIASLIYCVPQIPDRSNCILGHGESPYQHMLRGIGALRQMGAGAIAIPCNTAHYWYEDLQRSTDIPILHIVDATMREIQRLYGRSHSVGLMATDGTIKAGIYPRRLLSTGRSINCINLAREEQDALVMTGIRMVKSGDIRAAEELFADAALRLRARGAEVIIMACTEIPPALGSHEFEDLHLVDATACLAQAAIDWHRQTPPIDSMAA